MDTGGRDVEGRRVVYYRPNDYCPSEVPYTDLLRYLVFTLEMATREDEDAPVSYTHLTLPTIA